MIIRFAYINGEVHRGRGRGPGPVGMGFSGV